MICKVSEEMKDRETNAGGPEEAQTRRTEEEPGREIRQERLGKK